MANEYQYSIIPNTGITKDQLGNQNYLDGPVLPQGKDGSLSVGGWTDKNRGFWQQTFLGASIRSFNLNAGFGDSSSSLSVELVNDEYNISDGTHYGSGDDVYHRGSGSKLGSGDKFEPPVVGSPVFFKFGQNPATVEQAWRKTFDDTYGFYTFEDFELPFISGERLQDPNMPDGLLTKLNIPDKEYVFYSGATPAADYFVDRTKYYSIDEYDFKNRGENHFVFGGILQSFTENRGGGGSPLYSVQLSDPREILQNVSILLNNYQGTTYNYKNLINVYGFLEYDPSDELQAYLKSVFSRKRVLEKKVGSKGEVVYQNDDTWYAPSLIYPESFLPKDKEGNVIPPEIRYTASFAPALTTAIFQKDDVDFTVSDYAGDIAKLGWLGSDFPITGQGFSRRSEKGIPWYRVSQALAALFNYNGYLPREYRDAGFGGVINFRGYNYIVDFSGLPVHLIPKMYFMDFDQLDMLSLAQEICDITSHDLFVSLHPVIDHPACSRYYWRNRWEVEVNGNKSNQIVGIIRLDGINKTKQPKYGSINDYLKQLESRNIYVENRDVGYEVSNVTTDKFVVGAQEVEMYYFHNNKDRDELQLRRLKDGLPNHFDYLQEKQWELQTALSQQILPFYGFLGSEKAVSIPKGFGAYKQILIDTQSLDADGVGNYYVATELELRYAAVSYKRWKDFLLQYDEIYLENINLENQIYWGELSNNLGEKIEPIKRGFPETEEFLEFTQELDRIAGLQYAVSVPRSIWDSEKNWMDQDGLPASPCNPPYGYPLYYKRAERLGIAEAGMASLQNSVNQVMSNYNKLAEIEDQRDEYFIDNKDEAIAQIEYARRKLNESSLNDDSEENAPYQEYKRDVLEKLNSLEEVYKKSTDFMNNISSSYLAAIKNTHGTQQLMKSMSQLGKKHYKNSVKVHEFLKKIADECLGKKFLVKIPKACNVNFSDKISLYQDFSHNIATGPFGFKPLPVNSDASYISSPFFDLEISYLRAAFPISPFNEVFSHYIDYEKLKEEYPAINPKTLQSYTAKKAYTYGALKCNWNPVAESWDFNYKPEPQGGFFNYALYDQNMSLSEMQHLEDKPSELPRAVEQGLIPVDVNNLLVDGKNRISAYVRFDNSQYYDFSQIPSDNFIQQFRNKHGNRLFTPDVSQTLENVSPDLKDLEQESLNDAGSFDAMSSRIGKKYAGGADNESVAYVKCNVDEEFYMTPPIVKAPTHIWASDYNVYFGISSPTVYQYEDEDGCVKTGNLPSKPKPIFGVNTLGANGKSAAWIYPVEPLTEEFETTVKYPAAISVLSKYGAGWQLKSIIRSPSQKLGDGYEDVLLHRATGVTYGSGTPISLGLDAAGSPGNIKPDLLTFGRRYDKYLDSWLVITEKKHLDPDNVYALITLPGKILPVVEKRYCDAKLSSYQTVQLKNIMTQDVVRHIDFSVPAPKVNKPQPVDCNDLAFKNLDYEVVTRAEKQQRSIIRSAAEDVRKINFSSPSPVYPDIVALPLMSTERCYGPWQSANVLNVEADPRVRFSDIGGKVEFIKDENLAPWNFAGYQLLNEAGSLAAQLSNSLLLLTERGGFVYADYPSGIGLAKHLLDEGPLVTSIGVDVGNDGFKTTVKMDLYTSRFGKLQKQKEMAISQVARERQKIVDQNNAAIRRGLGKGQANMNLFGNVMKNGGAAITRLAKVNPEEYSELQRGSFSNKISMMQNSIDKDTASFVNRNIEIGHDSLDELRSLFPDSNDHLTMEARYFFKHNESESTTVQISNNQEPIQPLENLDPSQDQSNTGTPEGRAVTQKVLRSIGDEIGTFLDGLF